MTGYSNADGWTSAPQSSAEPCPAFALSSLADPSYLPSRWFDLGYWYSQGCSIGCPKCDHKNGRLQIDLCGLGKHATINEPLLRTVNRNATAGSEFDIYKHNPWRAPGTAPVADACGLAGGTPWGANVSEWGDYVATPYAHHGDYGSKVLSRQQTGAIWKRGTQQEVMWQITANHGGGERVTLSLVAGRKKLRHSCLTDPEGCARDSRPT